MTRTSIVVDGDRDRDSRGSRWNTKGKRTGEALGLQPAIESRMVIVGQHSKRPERQAGAVRKLSCSQEELDFLANKRIR